MVGIILVIICLLVFFMKADERKWKKTGNFRAIEGKIVKILLTILVLALIYAIYATGAGAK